MNTKQILKNAASNYGRMAVGIVTTLLLTPLILHRLGAEAYGMWTLTLAVAGYFTLMDLGITSAAIRYIAHYRALQDWENLNKTLASTLFCFAGMAILSLLISIVTAFFAPHLFHLIPSHILPMRLLILNVGLLSAIGFSTSMQTQCVIAAQRLDVLNQWGVGIQIASAILSALGIILGLGVLWLALLQLFSCITNGLVACILSRRFLPEARFRLKWDNEQGKVVFSFAGIAALISLSSRVIYYTDTLVIASFISVAAVAGYAVALKIADFMSGLVNSGVSVLGAVVGEQSALDNRESLSRMWSEGTKWSLVITLPITIILVIAGPEVISAWVGTTYAAAGTALAWIAVGRVFDLAQSAGYQILMNSGKHKVLGVLMIIEAVTNLALSILLIHRFGIIGVAIGTTLPLIVRSAVFYPFYMPRITGLSFFSYLQISVLPPLWTALPAVLIALLFKFFCPHDNKLVLLGLASTIGISTAITVYRFCLAENHRIKVRDVFAHRLRLKTARSQA